MEVFVMVEILFEEGSNIGYTSEAPESHLFSPMFDFQFMIT